jgi:hypothetical protein
MRRPLGCNASVRVAVQGALRRALPIEHGQLGLLNEEQKRALGRLNWQRACRKYGAGHRALLRLRHSELRVVSSIAPPGQAAVKSVKELMTGAAHGGLQPNKRMQPTALQFQGTSDCARPAESPQLMRAPLGGCSHQGSLSLTGVFQ